LSWDPGCEEQNHQILEIGRQIEKVLPEALLKIYEEKNDPRNYRVSFKKIHQKLGFSPSMTLEDGIIEIASALKDGKIGDFRDPKYSNYRSLTEDKSLDILMKSKINSLYFIPAPGSQASG